MRAVIMAGGKGTRLARINSDIPKPMFPILGKPILEYQIESLKRSYVEDITLIVCHKKEVIKDYFGNGERFGVRIDYIEENEPLGTAGALFYLKKEFGNFNEVGEFEDFRDLGDFFNDSEDFLLLFGDLMLDIDFNRFMTFHKQHKATITLFGHPNSHPYDSDLLVADNDNCVTGILSKKLERPFYYHNFVNAGVYCVNPKVLNIIKRPEKLDLEKNIIFTLIKHQNKYGQQSEPERSTQSCVYAYKSTEYVKDMGTPGRLNIVSADVENGVIRARNLKNKQKAIFLDRDGTIKKMYS